MKNRPLDPSQGLGTPEKLSQEIISLMRGETKPVLSEANLYPPIAMFE